jgi:methyl-accepting chemotaxis protein
MLATTYDDLQTAKPNGSSHSNGKTPKADGIALLLTQWISTIETYSHAINVLKTQLPKTAQLVESSTKGISDQFVDLAKGASVQSDQVKKIIDMAGTLEMGDQRITLQEFTQLFSKTLGDSLNQILYVSKQAISMVYQLDEAMTNLASIESFVKDIQTINKQANLLALNATIESVRAGEAGKSFGVVAHEVKQVSAQISNLSTNMRQRITAVTQSVRSGYKTLQEVATTDMTENIMAQEKLNLLMDSMMKQNTKFSSVLNDSAQASEELARTISGMVVGMQFQDRTTQYIENSVNLLSDMQQSIAKLKNDSSGLIPELVDVSHDKALASHISSQFKLSEFAQMFNDSLEGKPLNAINGHAKNSSTANADADNVELF